MKKELKRKIGNHKRKSVVYLNNNRKRKKREILATTTMALMGKATMQAKSTAHMISKAAGELMIDNFNSIKPQLPLNIEFPFAKQFERSIFDALLNIEGCTHLRVFNALTDTNEQTFVIMAIQDFDTPLYLPMETTDENGKVIEVQAVADMGNNCPSGYVKPESPL